MADRLSTLAYDLLAAVEQSAAALSVDLPVRRYIADGAVAWDCPQVCVELPTISRGRPGSGPPADINRDLDTYVAEYVLWILRSVPVPGNDGTPPSVALINASAETVMADGYVLTVGLRGPLRDIAKGCVSLASGTTTAEGPDGGLAGWRSSILVGL